MALGICRNAACPGAAAATPVDRYPGPGEFCPDCGQRLADLSPLQALQIMETAGPAPAPPVRRRRARPFVIAGAAVGLVTAGTLIALHPEAIGRPHGDAVTVCRSSISQRLAGDVVAAFRSANGATAPHVDLTRDGGGPCDVRFSVVWGGDANNSAVVGRDALVVVVNPQNTLAQLTAQQLRQVLTGQIRDWSQLGTGSGPIGVIVPDESTDEAAVLAKQILSGVPLARDVRRAASAAEVVAAVSGTQGRRLIGITTFSGAVPAKIVPLGSDAPPSLISIAQQRYPLAVAITVEAAGAAPPAEATDLVRFARSEAAQTIVARDGLIPLKGY